MMGKKLREHAVMGIIPKSAEFRSTEAGRINARIFLIILFNLIDGILTYIGVSKNYIVEMNLLMVNVVTDLNKLLLYKLLLPTLALTIIAFLLNKKGDKRMPFARKLVNTCFWIYVFVLATHFLWLVMLAIQKLRGIALL